MTGTRLQRLSYAAKAGVRTVRSRDFGATLATVQDGVDHGTFERLADHVAHDAMWQELLRDRPRFNSRTVSVCTLEALPEGTLGRMLLAHLQDHDLLRDVHVPESPFPSTPQAAYAKARWRETHDVRHVLTGLDISLRDEIVLQAFQLGQFRNWFAVCQMTVGPVLSPRTCWPVALVRDYRRAYRAGRAASALLPVYWERLYDRPVVELRAQFNVERLGGRP